MGRRKKKNKGSIQGLGVRYGLNVRKRYVRLVNERKKLHKCPKCEKLAVRHESIGIWFCKSCSYKFAGGAYTPTTRIGISAIRSSRESKS